MIDIQKLSTGQRIRSIYGHDATIEAVYYQGGEWRADISFSASGNVYAGVNNYNLERWELTR
jgi:hypothetical protein